VLSEDGHRISSVLTVRSPRSVVGPLENEVPPEPVLTQGWITGVRWRGSRAGGWACRGSGRAREASSVAFFWD
jgi:hypothetical protein